MKIACLFVLASSARAFAPTLPQRAAFVTAPRMVAEIETDFGSAMPDVASPYERLGVEKDKLALGLEADEVLQWIGTREDMVEKFMQDNKDFTRENAEMEIDKFLLDAEMVTAYINFEKNKGSISVREEAGEQNFFSAQKVIATYAAWVIGGFAFSYVRKNYIDPKFESGEWEEIHLDFGGLFGGSAEKAADAIPVAVEGAAPSVAAVQSVIESISDAVTSSV